jgi:hypothetical protein
VSMPDVLSGQPLAIPCDDLVGGKRHIIQPQVKVMAAPGRASLAGKLSWATFLLKPMISLKCGRPVHKPGTQRP